MASKLTAKQRQDKAAKARAATTAKVAALKKSNKSHVSLGRNMAAALAASKKVAATKKRAAAKNSRSRAK